MTFTYDTFYGNTHSAMDLLDKIVRGFEVVFATRFRSLW